MRGSGLAVALVACGRVGFHDAVTHDGGAAPVDAVDARAAIEYVQGTSVGSASGVEPTIAFDTAHAGDFVILPISDEADLDVTGVTDSRGDVYALSAPFTDAVTNIYFAYATIGAGSDASGLVATIALAKTGFVDLRMLEYSGVAGALDVAGGAHGDTEGSDVPQVSLTTTGADELCVALVVARSNSVAGTGFTQRTGLDGDISEDAVFAAAGPHEVTASNSGGSGWNLAAAAFR